MNLKYIIKRPIITEKSINQTAAGEYTFAVERRASKNQICQAIKEFFKVGVVGARTINIKGKDKRVGRARRLAKLPDWKKAIVKLAEGQKIDYFETGAGGKK